ncbi:hypothetical protein FE257_004496 [Aspergillus nanangensis]|uniref:Uncharacterized protein n=1 Tax=Aspergillus nanangensis TaxID=2582783 RepID=A0AAD4CY46_ASPNN|nr:hypothetical protein FE257_004496 [Aspergillus nanangensis]
MTDGGSEVIVNFSILIPVDVPGTTSSVLGDISYSLCASVTAEDGIARHVSRQVEIFHSFISDDPGMRIYARTFPDSRLNTTLMLYQPTTDSKSDCVFSGRLLIQGTVAESTGRPSEVNYAIIRQLKWCVEETVQLLDIKSGTSKETCKKTQVRKLCEGIRKGGWRLEDKAVSIDGRPQPKAEISFGFSIKRASAPANDVALSCFKRTPCDSCKYCISDNTHDTERFAITVNHHLNLELIVGIDTLSRTTGALVARRKAQNVFGAVYPLKITCADSTPPEFCPDIWLPAYNDVPNAPPAYVVP